jgi:hypothetical protein
MKFRYIAVMTLLITAAIAGCLGSEDDDDDESNETVITINGIEYTIQEIFEDFSTETVTASNEETYEGVPLEDLLEDAGVENIEDWQYRISATDNYVKEVTHLDIQEGILVEERVMTVFPDLPGKYRVYDIISIEPIEGHTITVNGQLYTWMQPFDIFDNDVSMSNETATFEGVLLSDLLNSTEIVDPQDHNYTIRASDDYQKEFTWDDMLKGILVDDEDKKVFFPHLDKKFHIRKVVEIEVV